MALSSYYNHGHYLLFQNQKLLVFQTEKIAQIGPFIMALSLYYYHGYYLLFYTQKLFVFQTEKNSSNWCVYNGSIMILLSWLLSII